MNLGLIEARDLVFKLKGNIPINIKVDIAVCPPFLYLLTICNILKDTQIITGAQNMFYKEEGAYTGEISPKMLTDLHIDMVIIGHSERRQFFHESDEEISLKIKSAFNHGLIPVFCVGEDLNIREKGKAEECVKKQLLTGIKDLQQNDIEKLIIAYEPIWAIGTGKICSGKDANKIIQMIRNTIKESFTNKAAEKVRILYGGSIKSDNFSEHISYPDIEGGLVGGASLKFDEFFKIISLANDAHAQNQNPVL